MTVTPHADPPSTAAMHDVLHGSGLFSFSGLPWPVAVFFRISAGSAILRFVFCGHEAEGPPQNESRLIRLFAILPFGGGFQGQLQFFICPDVNVFRLFPHDGKD